MADTPDWSNYVLLKAWDGTQFRDVLIDSSGQMFVLIKGYDGAAYRTVKVTTAGELYSLIKGYDGAAYRDVKLDTDGRIEALLKGAYGATVKTVLLDTDGRIEALMKGIEGTTIRTIALDASGNMVAVIKALYGSTLTNVAVDENGYIVLSPLGLNLMSKFGEVANTGTSTVIWTPATGKKVRVYALSYDVIHTGSSGTSNHQAYFTTSGDKLAYVRAFSGRGVSLTIAHTPNYLEGAVDETITISTNDAVNTNNSRWILYGREI